ncbi:MAG: DUF3990 domain-containing protein [Clostridia bacterium]
MAKIKIFHGLYTEIKDPKIIIGNFTKDFGEGFYCTVIREQAERWSKKYKTPKVNVYTMSLNSKLKILEFHGMTDEWLDFVINSRAGKKHDYDIVIGAMADDQIYNYISDYVDGAITREQFWVLAKFKYPTQQILFRTEESLKCITFVNCEDVI